MCRWSWDPRRHWLPPPRVASPPYEWVVVIYFTLSWYFSPKAEIGLAWHSGCRSRTAGLWKFTQKDREFLLQLRIQKLMWYWVDRYHHRSNFLCVRLPSQSNAPFALWSLIRAHLLLHWCTRLCGVFSCHARIWEMHRQIMVDIFVLAAASRSRPSIDRS